MATYTDITTFQRDVMLGSTDTIPPSILAQAAMIATAYINSHLTGIYAVPFTAPYADEIVSISNLLVRAIAIDLVAKRAPMIPKPAKGRPIGSGGYDFPCSWLDDISSGRASITGVSTISGAESLHTRDGFQPIFDVDSSLDHVPPRRLLEQIESERDI